MKKLMAFALLSLSSYSVFADDTTVTTTTVPQNNHTPICVTTQAREGTNDPVLINCPTYLTIRYNDGKVKIIRTDGKTLEIPND